MRRIAAIVALLGLVTIGLGASSASAAWTRFSPLANSSVFAHVGVARTADRVLHVVWLANENTPNETVMHTSFSAAGKLGATTTVSSGWGSLFPAALVTAPDNTTLVAFWGGVIPNDPNHQDLNGSFSTDGGKTWNLSQENLLTGNQYGPDTMSAARLGSNVYETWSSYLHFGTDPAPAFPFTASPADDCCCYDAVVAANSTSGGVLAAWFSNQTNFDGVYAQVVNPATGQPIGPSSLVPGTRGVGKALVPPALVAQQGTPGFMVAYKSGSPVGNRLLVWTAGSSRPVSLGSSQRDVDNFALADAPDGRVWAVWERFVGGRAQIVVRRSNAKGTIWGQPVLLNPPNRKDLWSVSASSIGGSLDVLGAFGDQGKIGEYETRVLPGLTVTAKPSKLSRQHKRQVRFTVLDAGAPVKGARVQAGTHAGHTNSAGQATVKLGPFGPGVRRVLVRVTAPGYTGALLQLAVR